MTTSNVLLLLLWLCSPGCKKQGSTPDPLPFAATPVVAPLLPGIVDEASGIADSKANRGAIWVEEDSGNPTRVQLLQYNGSLLGRVFIKNASNRDWEDMALAPGPIAGLSYLYIADIGDNNAQYTSYTIYRFPEPALTVDTIAAHDKINFQYPDGAHDAEAILVDPATKDIYIITKRDAVSKVYKLAYPQSTGTILQATPVGSLSFTGAVGAAISANGKEIIIKTYSNLYYWKHNQNESIEETLKKLPVVLNYQQEPQGEAVCFANDGTGFFTLSERSFAPSAGLHFYKRL
jgi:hypothetical protein